MANPEHLKVVEQGKKAIGKWRRKNLDVFFDLTRADLTHADLSGADLSDATLSSANLSGANLRKACLDFADLDGVNLTHADLREAHLSCADLREAKLGNANLSNAKLFNSNLSDTTLRSANLSGADLNFANLTHADLTHADLSNSLMGATTITSDLSETKGLDSVIHGFPSTLSIKTLRYFKDALPEKFLRGCGIEEKEIVHFRSRIGSPAKSHFWFINYSLEDSAFAIKLHDTLQGRGIRCWLDDKEILADDNMYEIADWGIPVYHKLLFCASKHSLTIPSVKYTLEQVFAKENRLYRKRDQNLYSIIPLNLDGYMLSEKWQHPNKNLIIERLYANFGGWENDNDLYETQVEKMIKALRADDAVLVP